MKSDVLLNLDRADGAYSAGDVIKGNVVVTLTQEIRAKAIIVHFYGYGRVSWDEHRAYTKGSAPVVSLKNSEQFLDQTIVLLKKEVEEGQLPHRGSNACAPFLPSLNTEAEECFTMTPGEHIYPFEFTLPTSLPSSYEAKWGTIRYAVKASLQRPWRDVDRETELTINAVMDLNDEPEHVRPIGALGEFHNGIICCPGYGPVSLELRIRRRGYVSGESIPFFAEIENHSGRKLHDAKVALVQHVTFKAGNKMKKLVTVITSLNRGEIQPGVSHTWEGDSLLIPPNLPLSSSKTMKTVQIRYRVALIIVHSAWSEEYTLPVMIAVGSVPLSRTTINSYLKLLGYATGDTPPRTSPNTTPRLSKTGHRLSNAGFVYVGGNPKLPLLPAGRGRQSVPAIHWSLDPLSGRRRCSAAVVLERPHHGLAPSTRSRGDSESSTSRSATAESPGSERKLEARRKSRTRAKSTTIIDEEQPPDDKSNSSSSLQSSKTSNRLTVPT